MEEARYAIKGGAEGRERLRLLSKVFRSTTHEFFERAKISRRAVCLDVGCGGGDVSMELATLFAPDGRVVGIDLDEEKLAIARREASELGAANVEFRRLDAGDFLGDGEYDVVYARFLLSHVGDPEACLRRMRQALKPGGTLLVEDIDFSGHFWYPECDAMARYVELFVGAVRKRGGDPYIGRRLPGLLMEVGLKDVATRVIQPAGHDPWIKRLEVVTLQSIAETLVAEDLAKPDEIARLAAEMQAFAEDEKAFGCAARAVQSWGTR